MKKGFTIIEVSILFVIFLIVACLVAPLSLDNSKQAKFIYKWKVVQQDFSNIIYSIYSQNVDEKFSFKANLEKIIDNETKNKIKDYRVIYLNGSNPSPEYRFINYNLTLANAVIAYKLFEQPQDELLGILMYDVNGKKGPNQWGKDVFGFNIYNDRFEPFGKKEAVSKQKRDCSKNGTGLYCSNYYLIGGNFD